MKERDFIKENVKRMLLREYIKGSIERAGFGGIHVTRNPMGTKIKITCERPGMIIGKKGKTIKDLTENLQKKFEIENPQIEVEDVRNPNINPHIMAYKLASAIEKGWHFRRAGHSTLRRIMESGAKGAQITLAGKLTGQRHRTEKFKQGHIKFCGDTKDKWMWEGRATVKKKLGLVGIKVQIMDPNARLPDEVEILTPEQWVAKKLELEQQKKAEEELKSAEAAKEALKILKESSKPRKKKSARKPKAERSGAEKRPRPKKKPKANEPIGKEVVAEPKAVKKPKAEKPADEVKPKAEKPAAEVKPKAEKPAAEAKPKAVKPAAEAKPKAVKKAKAEKPAAEKKPKTVKKAKVEKPAAEPKVEKAE